MRLYFCSTLKERPRIARISAVGVAKPPARVNIGMRRPGSVRSTSPVTRGSTSIQKSFSRSSELRFHPKRVSEAQLPPASTYCVATRSRSLRKRWSLPLPM